MMISNVSTRDYLVKLNFSVDYDNNTNINNTNTTGAYNEHWMTVDQIAIYGRII